MRRRFLVLVAAIVVLSVVACGDDQAPGEASATTASDGAGNALGGTLTVFAAASLTDAFAEVAAAFERANPGVTVQLNFAGSSSLREQILEGAPADVFASANESNMDQLVEADEIHDPVAFVTNSLRVVVPAGNSAGVTGLDDFADRELLIGLCAEQVPCGDVARQVLAAAGVTPEQDTDEADVRALLTKVEAGELDAGLVYVTDVVAAGDRVEGIDIPDELNMVATYPIGTVASSANSEAAAAFVAFVLSDEGQALFGQHGFGRP